jgi:hypothetical protein
MADEPDSLVLQLPRRMDTKLDRVIEDVQDLKIRMTHVEEGLAGVNRRIDRLEIRPGPVGRPFERSDPAR